MTATSSPTLISPEPCQDSGAAGAGVKDEQILINVVAVTPLAEIDLKNGFQRTYKTLSHCEGTAMDRVRVSSYECEVLRSAFKKSVIEEKIPEERWREHAALLIRTYKGRDDVDPELLDWIVRK